MSPLGLIPTEGSWLKSFRKNAKKEKVFRTEYLFFYMVAGEGLEPIRAKAVPLLAPAKHSRLAHYRVRYSLFLLFHPPSSSSTGREDG